MNFSKTYGDVTTLVIILMFHFQIGSQVGAQTYENTKQLREDLLANYHRDIRPVANQSEKIDINVTMNLYGIVDIDSVKGRNNMYYMCPGLTSWVKLTYNFSDIENSVTFKRAMFLDNSV